MAVSGIPRKRITITIPTSDYELLRVVAKEKNTTATGYVRRLVIHHLWNKRVEQYKAAERE